VVRLFPNGLICFWVVSCDFSRFLVCFRKREGGMSIGSGNKWYVQLSVQGF
jgi:hypothetical protein